MELVIGGAYQGKLEYALKEFNLTKDDVYNCIDENIDFDKRVINNFENYIWACNEKHIDPLIAINKFLDLEKDKGEKNASCCRIIICNDETQGVVPLDEKQRSYRELMGRTLTYLAKISNNVTRLFCGIAVKIK